VTSDLLEQLRVKLLVFRLRRGELAGFAVELVAVLIAEQRHDGLLGAVLVKIRFSA
jgi:hypothetical protein